MVESKLLTILGKLAQHNLFGLHRDQSMIGREALEHLIGAFDEDGERDYYIADVWQAVLMDIGAIVPVPWSKPGRSHDEYAIDYNRANALRFALTAFTYDGIITVETVAGEAHKS